MAEEMSSEMVVRVKELLAEPRFRIALHDFIIQELKKAVNKDVPVPGSGFRQVMSTYEENTRGLRQIAACIAYWGEEMHHSTLAIIHSRIADWTTDQPDACSRWYPLILILYTTGVSAIAAKRYANLSAALSASIPAPDHFMGRVMLKHSLYSIFLQMNREDRFQTLPGLERHYTARSQHIFVKSGA